jgi:hypothetical protein
MRLRPRTFTALALMLVMVGSGFQAFALTVHSADFGRVPPSPTDGAAASPRVYQIKKFVPPSGPREDCFGACRRNVTSCKKYAFDTSGNDATFYRNMLANCDVANRKCRATCEPLKNNPQ